MLFGQMVVSAQGGKPAKTADMAANNLSSTVDKKETANSVVLAKPHSSDSFDDDS